MPAKRSANVSKLAARVQALEDRSHALEDEQAILRTLYRYGHSIDYGLEQEFVDCFTEDGVFDHRFGRDRNRNVRFEGRASLAECIANVPKSPARYHKHLVASPRFAVKGNEAQCESYFVVLVNHKRVPCIYSFGRYKDHLVKGRDGRWRFKERIVKYESDHPEMTY